MSNSTTHPLESAVRAALQPPALHPTFDAALRQRLQAAAANPPLKPARRWRPARRWALAGLVAAVVLAITLAIGPQRVLAQVLGWFGYVPGTGYVETEGGLRILSNPHTYTQDGVSISIVDGLVDDTHTVLTILFEGIRQEQKPTSEDVAGCWPSPVLRLPDGRELEVIGGGGGGGSTWMRMELTYPALPLDVNEATLQIPCVPEVMPGLGPENMEMPLLFEPAPEGFLALPVQPLNQATELAPAPHGFALSVEDYVELDDGYLIRGRLSWEESEFTSPQFWWFEFTLVDADGNNIPVEFEEFPNPPTDPNQRYLMWTVRTNTKYIASPASIMLAELSVNVNQPREGASGFEIDLGTNPADGQTWQPGATFQVGAYEAFVESATFAAREDGTYSLVSRINFDPQHITTLAVFDLDNQSQMWAWAGGGDIAAGVLEAGFIYDYFPTGVHRFVLDNYYLRLIGPWAAGLTLPPPSGEPLQPGACLQEESWQALREAALPLPDSIRGQFLVEGPPPQGVYFPSLFITDARGQQRRELPPGGWGAFSPDGRHVAYANNGLYVHAVDSDTDTRLGDGFSPVWSPSGQRLAYLNNGLWVANADGTQQRAVPGSFADMAGIAGWLPDEVHLVVLANTPAGMQVQQVNITTGAAQDLFVLDSLKTAFAKLSPDGEWLAYSANVFGSIQKGIYISRLDGSQTRLVAQPGSEAIFITGAWSPDSRWLLLNPYNIAQTSPVPYNPVLVDTQGCQPLLVPGVLGNVVGWAP